MRATSGTNTTTILAMVEVTTSRGVVYRVMATGEMIIKVLIKIITNTMARKVDLFQTLTMWVKVLI
jgi:hypothetical protein